MDRLEELKAFLRPRAEHGIALAFSGGTDSSFLLAVLKEIHDGSPFPLAAFYMQTVFQTDSELEQARAAAAEAGVGLAVFRCDPLALPELRSNPPDRCYLCKHHLFGQFLDAARSRGLETLLDGTNADDLKVYRPGRRALQELGVVSPLAELGFTKAEIRKLAAVRGLSCAKKPSLPCLATRFEYGTELTPELLERTGKGEELIRKLLPPETDVRLRVHGDLARIEVSPAALPLVLDCRNEINAGLKRLGFKFLTLDLEGFRSGCYDTKQE
ncbi:MAG: ATP-dependent sacrificial sulfur transferase LarE [Lentisphaeria bacterium]|nr:ATP-dependent sacrificial sulfur transferase LarE [Lentisphaeria bacterium]